MDSSSVVTAPPLLAGLRAAAEALARVEDAATWQCSQDELVAALDVVTELAARAAGTQVALIGEADERGVPAEYGGGPIAALLRHRYRLDPKAARALEGHAFATRQVFPAVQAGQRAGRVSPEQAAAIVAGLDRLPPTSTGDERAEAQAFLVDGCRSLEPRELRTAARHICEKLTRVSADGPEPADEPVPDPYDRRSLTFSARDGGLSLRGFVPGADAAWLLNLLAARAQPDSAGHGDPTHPLGHDTRGLPQRQYDAVADTMRHAAGCAEDPAPAVAQVFVTADYDQLRQALSGATLLDLDQPIDPAELRLLACDADLIPAVLGGRGEVLDVGRAHRLFPTGIRRALALRDQGCSFPGCERPPAGCHAHHLTISWQDWGPTSLVNGTLLCPHHHRQVHRQGWTGRLDAHGLPEFVPPAWIDPQQQPRQHHRFPLRR